MVALFVGYLQSNLLPVADKFPACFFKTKSATNREAKFLYCCSAETRLQNRRTIVLQLLWLRHSSGRFHCCWRFRSLYGYSSDRESPCSCDPQATDADNNPGHSRKLSGNRTFAIHSLEVYIRIQFSLQLLFLFCSSSSFSHIVSTKYERQHQIDRLGILS